MSYFLFLDDIRQSTQFLWPIDITKLEVITARNFKEFQHTVRTRGIPVVVSFDFDTCHAHYAEFGRSNQTSINYKSKEPTGLDCCKFLVEEWCRTKLPLPRYFLHTFNPLGKRAMRDFLEQAKIELICNTVQ